MSDIADRIAIWFAEHGADAYDGARRESVSALEHALQCAQLAEFAHAAPTLVVASLLHDIGHFSGDSLGDAVDDAHEQRAACALANWFAPAVVEPVRLHVAAKRYLTAIDAAYLGGLSPASLHSLSLQGGAMTPTERRRFAILPFADEAVMLRRWDDLAKLPGRHTPPLGYYLALVDEVAAQRTATPAG
jgi:predicted HD phosphohydrolase